MDIAFQLSEFIALLLIACAVGIVVKFIRLPYTIALVLVGLFVGMTKLLPEIPLTKELVFLLILPPLLFEGALNMDIEHLRENLKPISLLAILGVLVSTIIVGLILHRVLSIPLEIALLFGAMISPTDPVSVLATFKSLGAPKKLSTILEGESILNDGTGIVLFGILLEMIRHGSLDLAKGVAEFLIVCIGGIAIGFTLGYLAYRFLAYIDDHLIEISITLILAYSSFLIAEDFHFSGVIAVVCAGLIIGNYGRFFSMSPSTRIALMDFWSFVVFVINSIVFLLIGIDTHLDVFHEWRAIGVAILAGLIARAIAVYPILSVFRLPNVWKHVIFWGGLHGTIPVALALSLGEIPHRDLLASMTFGVVIFSLVFQGLSLEFFARRVFKEQRKEEFEETFARFIALKHAKAELSKLVEEGKVVESVAERIGRELEDNIWRMHKKLENFITEDEMISAEIVKRAYKNVLNAQKSAIRDAVMKGLISEDVANKIIKEIDSKIAESENKEVRECQDKRLK